MQALQSLLTGEQKVIIVGVDDDSSPKLSDRRERKMLANIKAACPNTEEPEIIYPVGAAHIYDTERNCEMLASYIQASKDFKLQFANFYPPNGRREYVSKSNIPLLTIPIIDGLVPVEVLYVLPASEII